MIEMKRIDCSLTVTKDLSEDGTFEGYGSVFDVLDSDREIVVKGAFEKSLKEKGPRGIKFLWQHRTDQPVGIFPEMGEDERGLFLKGDIATAASQGRDAYELLKIGALDGLSIGFRTVKSEIDEEVRIRKLVEIDLWEVSLVTFPANSQARVSAVKDDVAFAGLAGMASTIETERDFEGLLRDVGYSQQEAKAITANGFKSLVAAQRDVGAEADLIAAMKAASGVISHQ